MDSQPYWVFACASGEKSCEGERLHYVTANRGAAIPGNTEWKLRIQRASDAEKAATFWIEKLKRSREVNLNSRNLDHALGRRRNGEKQEPSATAGIIHWQCARILHISPGDNDPYAGLIYTNRV